MISSKTLKIATAATALLSAHFAYSVSLQDLTQGYDVFVEGDATLKNSVHIEGSIAVGGTLTLEGSKSEFGRRVTTSDHTVLANKIMLGAGAAAGTIVTEDATEYSVHVENLVGTQAILIEDNGLKSRLVEGVSPSVTTIFNAENKGPITTGATDTFTGAWSQIEALSNSLKGADAGEGFVPDLSETQTLELFFGNSGLGRVINLTTSMLTGITQIKVHDNSESNESVVVNVDVSEVGMNPFAGINMNLVDDSTEFLGSDLVWNFFSSSSILSSEVILDGWFVGSILAPDLTIKQTYNNIEGSIVAAGLYKENGEVHPGSWKTKSVPDSGSTAFLFLLSIPAFVALRRRMK